MCPALASPPPPDPQANICLEYPPHDEAKMPRGNDLKQLGMHMLHVQLGLEAHLKATEAKACSKVQGEEKGGTTGRSERAGGKRSAHSLRVCVAILSLFPNNGLAISGAIA